MADRGRNGMDHWPVANHIVNDKFREYCMRKHYERISSVRPMIDTEAPMEYFHMKYNARKAMREAERLHEIEQENRILLEKMLKIASHDPWKHNKSWRLRPTTGYKRGMYYDPVRQSLFTDHINIPGAVRLKGGQAKYRKEQELLRITKDNLAMLERIQQVKAHYSHSKMEGGHVEDLRRREQLTKFRGPEHARYMSPGFKCVNSRVLSEDAAKTLDNLKTSAGEEAKLAFSRSMSRRIPVEEEEEPAPEPEPKPEVEPEPEEKKPLFGSGFRFSGAVMKVLQTIRPNKPADKFSNAVDMVKLVTKMRKKQENKVMNNMSRTSRLAAGLSGNLGVEEEGPKKKTVKVDKKLAAYATPIQPQLKTTFNKSYNDLNRSWSTKVRYVDTSTAPSAATSRKTSRAPSMRGDDEDNADLFADV